MSGAILAPTLAGMNFLKIEIILAETAGRMIYKKLGANTKIAVENFESVR
jgi:hypothetical protein